MSTRFVYVGGGYLNLSQIERVRIKRDGRHELIVNGAVVDDNHPDFPAAIASVIQPQGEWECLSTISEEDGSLSLYDEPILAWGFTVTGNLVPITAGELGGVEGEFGLRKVGDARVYTIDITYPDADSWLLDQNRKQNK